MIWCKLVPKVSWIIHQHKPAFYLYKKTSICRGKKKFCNIGLQVKTKPSKKLQKLISRVTSRSANFSEAERNKAKLATMRLNGLKPKVEFYCTERVLTDVEIAHIMVRNLLFQMGQSRPLFPFLFGLFNISIICPTNLWKNNQYVSGAGIRNQNLLNMCHPHRTTRPGQTNI